MKINETQKKQINEADYIDITIYIRAFFRLARRSLFMIFPMIVCLTAGISLLSRALVKEQYVAETTFVVGVTLSEDLSYNYNLSELREDYVVQMSEAFQSVIKSDYMYYLLEEELGRVIPGEINWENTYGTNMGGVYVVSDSMENAEQLRDAVITCLPKALLTTLGDIELKIMGTSGRTEVLHGELSSPLIWAAAGVAGSVFAYLGIIFLMTLCRHDIDTSDDMAKITDLPCLGSLPKSVKMPLGKKLKHIRSSNAHEEYNRAFSEFRKQLEDVMGQQPLKTLLFTGVYKKCGQTELLDKLTHDWTDQGKKVRCIDLSLSKVPKTAIQIQEELNQQIEESLEEAELIIINGPDYDHTVELLSAADCVDGLVYVVKAGYDQMESTKEAIYTLGFTKAKTLGYVITV